MLKPLFFLALVFVFLVGCSSTPKDDTSWLRDRDYDYRFAKETKRTVIPKGLDENRMMDFYPVPPLSTPDTPFVDGLVMPHAQVAADKIKVKIQRLNGREWLLVRASPSQLWPLLKEHLLGDQMTITKEQGGEGLFFVKNAKGSYQFHVGQGFQRNTSELSLVYKPSASATKKAVKQIEQDYLKKVGVYFTGALDKPSYSYAARGIGTEPTMRLERDPKLGDVLVLNVDHARAVASVKQAMKKASFKVERSDGATTTDIMATYYPMLAKQPGFFSKIFGADPHGLDQSIAHAGNHYKVVIKSLSKEQQQVSIQSTGSGNATSTNENRDMMLLLKKYMT